MDHTDKPVQKWYKKWWVWFLVIVFLIIVIGSTNPKESSTTTAGVQQPVVVADAKQETPAAPAVDKNVAQQQLADFMAKAKQATLITSYEFSDNANVVYVGAVWYSQTAIQKKDFLAYVSKLKEAATGYHHFEVRDAYSDEKVAEVTAFSGALEVYK